MKLKSGIFIIYLFTQQPSFSQNNKLPVYFQENFDDNSNNWPTGGKSEIKEGKYIIDNASGVEYYLEKTHTINAYQEYSIETAFEVTRYSDDLQYGIHWGNKTTNGCYFVVGKSQNFKVGKWYNGAEKIYKDWTIDAKI